MAAPRQTKLAAFELLGLLFGLSACILMTIHNVQPQPYMDEFFHHRQTVKYCEGKFTEWDPMITTLPGLYAVTVAAMNLVSVIFDYEMMVLCDLFWMRCINLVFCVGNAILIYLLYNTKHSVKEKESQEEWRVIFNVFTIAVFPPLYFFTFLYYTDVGSVFFVLLMYYTAQREYYKSSAIVGLVAVCFRQTNVIWVLFVAGEQLANILLESARPEKKEFSDEDIRTFRIIVPLFRTILSNFRSFYRLRILMKPVLAICTAYVLVGVVFVIFVIWNRGIVVGDRSAHQVCFHLPQLLYFFSFSAVFTFMYHITFSKIMTFVRECLKHPYLLVSTVVLILCTIYFFTYEHPYLLADNRHYTFYVWSKIFKRQRLIKYALVLGYIYAAYSTFELLSHKSILWKLVFFICLFASTVPQKLLEFRYFIIPFLVFRLNMRSGSIVQTFLEACLYIAVNSFTIYYFIEKTFLWPDSATTQRFIW